MKQEPDKLFGGVSIFLFGDILQLRPVRARYIFEEPSSETFQIPSSIKPLWNMFKTVLLRKNHRQGEDKSYADTLNRIRRGILTDEDIETLESRVFPSNDSRIPQEALVITCTNAEVNRINEERLNLIDEREIVVDSINKHSTQNMSLYI